jgi:heme exporter protein D
MFAMKAHNTWVFTAIGVVAVLIVCTIISLDLHDFPRYSIIRAAAMLGYLSVFVTSISSLYMKQLTQFFGRPFIRTHHIVAVTGLILLATHALFNAWYSETLSVFIPRLESARDFLAHGGRAALLLLGLGVLAALLRTRFRRNWRVVHWFNYLAFFIATFHAFSLGTDFRYPLIKVAALIMVCMLVSCFVLKRVQQQRRMAKIKKSV